MLFEGENIGDCDYTEDYATKYGRKYQIKTFPSTLVSLAAKEKLKPEYKVEAIVYDTDSINENLSFSINFENRLYTTEKGGKEEIKERMKQLAVLHTKISLENGARGNKVIEVNSKTLENRTLVEEIRRLEKELKNLQEKKIGF